MKKINLLFVSFILLFTACEDMNYEEKAADVSSLKNIEINGESGNILLSWDRPADVNSFSVILNYNGIESIIPDNPTKDTIYNAAVNIEHTITLKVRTSDYRVSEGVTAHITVNGTDPVENLLAQREENDILVTWNLPENNKATKIEVIWDNEKIELPATSTFYRISNVSADKRYEIGVKTKNETIESNYVYTVVNSLKFAFITTYENISDIEDDDELAAANWFVANYPTGEIIPVSKIRNGETDLSTFSVAWIHIDRVGTGNLPGELKDADVISKIAAYYKAGGNLLLSIHATQYIADLGRLAENRKPGIIAAGTGGVGNDTWTFNANIGMKYDHFNHPLFDGITADASFFGHPTIPLIGPGNREDHNSMWDLNSYGYQIPVAGENVVDAFQKENNATVLATWGHVTDFCCGGIIEFKPSGAYQGHCIAIGLAAYEWNQNTGINSYQSNIEKMTTNAINYLK